MMSRLQTFLTGVKVLDLSQYIPGPMASLLLADMGAQVLKIEPPQGDEMRNLGPRDAQGQPLFYNALNAGKQVRRMDLKLSWSAKSFSRWWPGLTCWLKVFAPVSWRGWASIMRP